MDSLLAIAYGIVGMFLGFVLGLFIRRAYVDRRPPDGGELPLPAPMDLGPDDWARWEDELRLVSRA